MLEIAGVNVLGEARSATEAATLVGKLKPDVVVIDLNMPDVADGGTLRRIAAASPEARIVVLTASTDKADVIKALEAGACGYILKDTQADELVGGIRQVAGSHVVLSRAAMQTLVASAGSGDHTKDGLQTAVRRPELTRREMDVLRLVVDGQDNATIGLQLSISRHTVKQHVTNIFEKLGVRTRVEAAVYAVRAGLF
jgi:DNA-binding NarL/FixJ family response regulator